MQQLVVHELDVVDPDPDPDLGLGPDLGPDPDLEHLFLVKVDVEHVVVKF